MKLEIELVPSTAWYSNVRKILKPKHWDIIRRKCYKAAGHKCELCGGKGKKHPVECHEIWEYDEDTKIQSLKGFISLCPSCHQVKHAGLACIRGKKEAVFNQLMKVNSISRSEAIKHFNEAFKLFDERSQFDWSTDISYFLEYIKD